MEKIFRSIIAVGLSCVMVISIISIGALTTGAEVNDATGNQRQAKANVAGETTNTVGETATQTNETATVADETTKKDGESETTSIKAETSTAIKESGQDLTEDEKLVMAEKNHRDEATGISVYGEELPWYVKVVCEKTDEKQFQEKYEKYLEEWYGTDDDIEDEEEWEDSDLYDEDEEIAEDEDLNNEENAYGEEAEEDIDEEDEENKGDENAEIFSEFLNNQLGYRADDERVHTFATSYKIYLYDTLEEKEYILPKGQTVKVYLPYLREYLGYETEVVHWKEENVYEYTYPGLFDKTKGEMVQWIWRDDYDYDVAYGIIKQKKTEEKDAGVVYPGEDDIKKDDDDAESADSEYGVEEESLEEETLDEEAHRKLVQEANEKIEIGNYSLVFETDSFSEFGIRLGGNYKVTDESVAEGNFVQKGKKLSPKTGYSLWMPLGVLFVAGTLVVTAIICRKRESHIV